MKLITNTVGEAKENGDLCFKENFESESILDCNMKDLKTDDLEINIVNGGGDSSCKDLIKLNGDIDKRDGVVTSGELAKPLNGAFSDCEDISDGELNFVLSDEEDNLLTDKDNSACPSKTSTSTDDLNKLEKNRENNSEKIVNGYSDAQELSTGDKKDDTSSALISEKKCEDSCIVKEKDEDELRKEVADDFSEVTGNVKETVEICTTDEEVAEDNCHTVEGKNSEDVSLVEKEDEGSDAENDREAEEKLLTLLKETPPELVLLPEDNNDSEKDLESDIDEENNLLSLLEDSQSDSTLNLLNEVIDSSCLTELGNVKKAEEVLEKSKVNKPASDKSKTHDKEHETSEVIKSESGNFKKGNQELANPKLIKSESDSCSNGVQHDHVLQKLKVIESESVSSKIYNKEFEKLELIKSELNSSKKDDKVSEAIKSLSSSSKNDDKEFEKPELINSKSENSNENAIALKNLVLAESESRHSTKDDGKLDVSESELCNSTKDFESKLPKSKVKLACSELQPIDNNHENEDATLKMEINVEAAIKKDPFNTTSEKEKYSISSSEVTAEKKKDPFHDEALAEKSYDDCDNIEVSDKSSKDEESIRKSSIKNRNLQTGSTDTTSSNLLNVDHLSSEDISGDKSSGTKINLDKADNLLPSTKDNSDKADNSLSCNKVNPDKAAESSLCTKRNFDDVQNSSVAAKRLKRSASCNKKNKIQCRKRSYSVDDKVMSNKIYVKRLCPSIGVELSEKLPKPSENEKNFEDELNSENVIDSAKKSEESKVESSEIDSGKKIALNCEEMLVDEDKNETVVNIVNSKSVKKTKNISKLVAKSSKGKVNTNEIVSEENSKETDKRKETGSDPNIEKDSCSVPSKNATGHGVKRLSVGARGSWKNITKDLSLIAKIHKEKFKSLTKWDLEELIVQKICEVISSRCEVGELMQEIRRLEQVIENWRKKAALIEKSNREMRTVLNRYLKEVDDNIADKTKPIIPIRITRSVGLQVVPPVSQDRSKGLNRFAQQQKQADNIRTLRPSAPPGGRDINNAVGTKTSSTVSAPSRLSAVASRPNVAKPTVSKVQVSHGGNVAMKRITQVNKIHESSSPAPSTGAANKRVVATVPAPSNSVSSSCVSSDLEVIDLTEKDERNIAKAMMTSNNQVRIVPRPSSNTVGVSPTAVAQPMTFVVPTSAMQAVRGNQRPQLFLSTTTANGTAQLRPVTTATVVAGRPNPATQTLTIPGAVVMKNGTLVPISSQPTSVVVRSSTPVVQRNVQQLRLASPVTVTTQSQPLSHPAPLPACPVFPTQVGWLLIPPKPILKVSKTNNGIMLSWSMTLNKNHEEIASYQLYAYQESHNIPPSSSLWKKVGDVKALPLPMACTLTQFVEGHKYHFAVRAVDVHSRVGQFSYPSTILLK